MAKSLHHVHQEPPPLGRTSPSAGAAPSAGVLVGGVFKEAGARRHPVVLVSEFAGMQRGRAPYVGVPPAAARRRVGDLEAKGHEAAASGMAGAAEAEVVQASGTAGLATLKLPTPSRRLSRRRRRARLAHAPAREAHPWGAPPTTSGAARWLRLQ
jgi:hypothetical protein